ncbi:Uu.00g089280.m01.CDS01 [Anthostomella pinea]|uniref:Uu.00g089280.m01.CDS01 n=1 Tax=Anthostomella pinea TaxID=933095 RepID=A0AAI8YK70_9PEZI|nr:Uu.00g089280.m01.CDS01 [Anthostomella pinea]
MAFKREDHVVREEPTHPEVHEYMVRRLDGQILPVFTATPDSGVVYDGLTHEWVPEHVEDVINLDQTYSHCINAQNSLVVTANKLARKRKLPSIDLNTIHSWTEVEESVIGTCNTLEAIPERDNAIPSGFINKLKGGSRSLCKHAGAGITLAKVVPTDSYLSVLAGGLTGVFTALQKTGQYRKDILDALEDITFVLNDHAALLHLDEQDEELHRRAASLYRSLFSLLEAILQWFLKKTLVTGVKTLIDSSGFSEQLKSRRDDVKLSVERFRRHTNQIYARKQNAMLQQNNTMLYMQGTSINMHNRNSHEILGELAQMQRTLSRIAVLEKLEFFLNVDQDAMEERIALIVARRAKPKSKLRAVDIDGIFEHYLYEPRLITTDSNSLLDVPFRPGYDMDEHRILAIRQNPSFKAWLVLDQSSMLLLNANSEMASSLEMSYLSAKTFQRVLEISTEQADAPTKLITLAFFCSRHQDYMRDINGKPAELAMTLLLQLLDQYRDFDQNMLAAIPDPLDPDDLGSICLTFGCLLAALPQNVIVILIIDGLRFYTQPARRRDLTRHVIEYLVDSIFIEDLFTNDEVLNIPKSMWATEGYNTSVWKKPMALERPANGFTDIDMIEAIVSSNCKDYLGS